MTAPAPQCQPKHTAARQDFTPQELLAWADEAQACLDSGEVIVSDHRKADATIMALRTHATLKSDLAQCTEANHHYRAAVDALERNARVQATLLADTGRRVEELETALREISNLYVNAPGWAAPEPSHQREYKMHQIARAALNRGAGK